MPAISGKASYHSVKPRPFSLVKAASFVVCWILGTILIGMITIFPTVLMYYLIGKTIVSAFKGG